MWKLIGTSAPLASSIAPNTASMTVLNRIPWNSNDPNFPGPGHYCFVAVVYSSEDTNPIPDPGQITQTLTFNQYLDLIRTNNNITWDNFDVLPIPPRPMLMRFLAPGAFDCDRPMQLEVVARLPEGAQLFLEGPARFVNALQKGYYEEVRKDRLRIPLSPYGMNRFKEILFPANSQNQLELSADIPPTQRTRDAEIYVRQLFEGEEIGRITWRLMPPVKKDWRYWLDYLQNFFASIFPLNCLLLFLIALALLIIIYLLLR
jgi:hypothetical protein